MSDRIEQLPVPKLTPASTLEELLAVFVVAREWSCDVDEQVRAEGNHAMSGVIGIPLHQLDAIIVILEGAAASQANLVASERAFAAMRRAQLVARICGAVCLALSLVNLAYVIAEWI